MMRLRRPGTNMGRGTPESGACARQAGRCASRDREREDLMTEETQGDGAGGSALVFEQRIQDLCHDELFEQGTGNEVAYDLLSNELRRIPDWLKVPNGANARASRVAEDPVNANECTPEGREVAANKL